MADIDLWGCPPAPRKRTISWGGAVPRWRWEAYNKTFERSGPVYEIRWEGSRMEARVYGARQWHSFIAISDADVRGALEMVSLREKCWRKRLGRWLLNDKDVLL